MAAALPQLDDRCIPNREKIKKKCNQYIEKKPLMIYRNENIYKHGIDKNISRLAHEFVNQVNGYNNFMLYDIPNISSKVKKLDNPYIKGDSSVYVINTLINISKNYDSSICNLLVFNESDVRFLWNPQDNIYHEIYLNIDNKYKLYKHSSNLFYYIIFPVEEFIDPGEYDDIFILYVGLLLTCIKGKINIVTLVSYDNYYNIQHNTIIKYNDDLIDPNKPKALGCTKDGLKYYYGTSVYYEEVIPLFFMHDNENYVKLLHFSRENNISTIKIQDRLDETIIEAPLFNKLFITIPPMKKEENPSEAASAGSKTPSVGSKKPSSLSAEASVFLPEHIQDPLFYYNPQTLQWQPDYINDSRWYFDKHTSIWYFQDPDWNPEERDLRWGFDEHSSQWYILPEYSQFFKKYLKYKSKYLRLLNKLSTKI